MPATPVNELFPMDLRTGVQLPPAPPAFAFRDAKRFGWQASFLEFVWTLLRETRRLPAEAGLAERSEGKAAQEGVDVGCWTCAFRDAKREGWTGLPQESAYCQRAPAT